RPFITLEMIQKAILAGLQHGAATVSVPLKFTIKECNADRFVTQTPDREKYCEIQTPQVVRREWLQRGFAIAHQRDISVTDDVSLAELVGHKVKLVEGSYSNIKVTTPEDLEIAQVFARRYEA